MERIKGKHIKLKKKKKPFMCVRKLYVIRLRNIMIVFLSVFVPSVRPDANSSYKMSSSNLFLHSQSAICHWNIERNEIYLNAILFQLFITDDFHSVNRGIAKTFKFFYFQCHYVEVQPFLFLPSIFILIFCLIGVLESASGLIWNDLERK